MGSKSSVELASNSVQLMNLYPLPHFVHHGYSSLRRSLLPSIQSSLSISKVWRLEEERSLHHFSLRM